MSTAEQSDGRYLIESKLGEGGAGVVYLARDRETGEQLALKKLLRIDGKSILRLKREFRSMQVINHPHIVKLYDMGQVADSWYLTMEYLDGPDLQTYLRAPYRNGATVSDAIAADPTSPSGQRLDVGMRHETVRDEYALGMVLAPDQGGARLRDESEQRMREMAVANPKADVRAYYPELFEVE